MRVKDQSILTLWHSKRSFNTQKSGNLITQLRVKVVPFRLLIKLSLVLFQILIRLLLLTQIKLFQELKIIPFLVLPLAPMRFLQKTELKKSTTRMILHSGKLLNPMNHHGTLHGVLDALDGILSVLWCQKWVFWTILTVLTCILVVRTCNFLITRMKLRSWRLITMVLLTVK